MGYVVNKRRFMQSGSSGYTVTIIIDSHIKHTGGDLVQSNLTGAMTPVTLSPKDTYRIDQLSGSSGITVTASGNNYVISGTPTANVNLNFTTTQNADVLTSTQKNFANWTHSVPATNIDGFIISRGSTESIIWELQPRQSNVKNQGYYYQISSSQVPVNVPFMFSLTYCVDPGVNNDGCKIGISTNNSNVSIGSSMVGSITISETQTEYITKTFKFTRTQNSDLYLVIVNSHYSLNYGSYYSGTIRIQEMTLRRV